MGGMGGTTLVRPRGSIELKTAQSFRKKSGP
jgi:hypothetical protein